MAARLNGAKSVPNIVGPILSNEKMVDLSVQQPTMFTLLKSGEGAPDHMLALRLTLLTLATLA